MNREHAPSDDLAERELEDWTRARRDVLLDPALADRVLERCREVPAPSADLRRPALSPLATAVLAVAASLLFLLQGAALLSVLVPR